jgi:hypothetical protein
MGHKHFYMSRLELLDSMLDRSNYDPVIWEDVKNVTDELEKRIDTLTEENESLLNDFCDLIQILLDGGDTLSQPTLEAIKQRFLNNKNQ